MCTGAHPCLKCCESIKWKRMWKTDPAWTLHHSLQLVAFNKYRLPFATPRAHVKCQMIARLGGAYEQMAPEGVPAEQPSCVRLDELKEEIRIVIQSEDFMQAEQCRREKVKIEADLALQTIHDAPPKAYGVITKQGDVWSTRGPGEPSPFLSWTELKILGEVQREVFLPISSLAKRELAVLCCVRPRCRYLAKTPTELARHTNLAHPGPVASPALAHPAAADAPPLVSVGGLPPQLRQRKRRAPGAPAAEAEGDQRGIKGLHRTAHEMCI